MALLGAQLVITLIMVSVIQKLGQHYSLARWLLCSTGLIRYLYPTDDELRALAGLQKTSVKGNKKGRHGGENGKTHETFHVPRSLDIQLETAQVSKLDVVHLRYYTEYQWLVDFALYALIVYIATEVAQNIFPFKEEINLSIVWCFLVVLFSTKLLLTLTWQYFQGEESVGERSTVIVTSFAYLLLAMMILIVDENNLELGLDRAYTSFNKSAAIFLDSQGIDSSGPASKIVIKFFLALWCSMIGALLTFPGLRMAKMHWDTLRYCNERRLLKLLLNINFALPFILTVLWVKPLSREYLVNRVFSGMSAPLMSEGTFESVRLLLILVTAVLRFIVMPTYLQSYLNMAYNRIEEQKKEAGRITNVELQKKIAAVFYYLCVVTIQYLAPVLMALFYSFMLKSLGGYTWGGMFYDPAPLDECSLNPGKSFVKFSTEDESIRSSAQQFTLALDSLKQVFTVEVYRGLFSFTTWWVCFTWFLNSSMGLVYQSYFTHI